MGFFSRLFRREDPVSRPSASAAFQTASWPFDQSPHTAAITTRQVLEENAEIRAVVHYSDDHSWAFLCGTTDDQADGRVTTMAEAVGIDDSVRAVADLPPGWKAWRDRRGAEWQRAENFARG